MATKEEKDEPQSGSEEEEHVAPEEQPYKDELVHVDALLNISQDDFLKELEPHECHCYPGWEEAVRGWARVAPLSCILVPQRMDGKAKPKEADPPSDATVWGGGPSACEVEGHQELPAAPHDSLKEYSPPNQQVGSCAHCAAEAQQSVLDAVQTNMSQLALEESSGARWTPLRPQRPLTQLSESRRHGQRPSAAAAGTMVPIKNITFLPPIESLYKPGGQLCSYRRLPEELAQTCSRFDKRSSSRGLRAPGSDVPLYSAALTSKHRTGQLLRYTSAARYCLPDRTASSNLTQTH